MGEMDGAFEDPLPVLAVHVSSVRLPESVADLWLYLTGISAACPDLSAEQLLQVARTTWPGLVQ